MFDRLRSLRSRRHGGQGERDTGAREGRASVLRDVSTAPRVLPATGAENERAAVHQREGARSRGEPRAARTTWSPVLPSPPTGTYETQTTEVPIGPTPGIPFVIPAPASSPILDEILRLLRESRRAQSALIDQQRETLLYMRRLDEWLNRGVRERDDDIQHLAMNIENLSNELRDELGRLGLLRSDRQTYIQRDQAGRRTRRRRM